MTDPLFLTLALLYFILLHRLRRHPSKKMIISQGLLLAWLILTRPIGGTFFIPTFLAIDREQRGVSRSILLVALFAWLPFPIWMYRASGTPTDYLQYWRQEIPLLQGNLLGNIHRVNYFIFCENLFGLRLPPLASICQPLSFR